MEEAHRPGRAIAVANLILDDSGSEAELGLLVEDSWQNQGLGTRFVAYLLECARAFGCRVVIASVQSDNTPMLSLAFRYGASCSWFEDTMDLSIPIAAA
jgi:GNAT superfamily N-acetyltransferase